MTDTPGLSSEDAKKIADALRASATTALPGSTAAANAGILSLTNMLSGGSVSLAAFAKKAGLSAGSATVLSGVLTEATGVLSKLSDQAIAASNAMFSMYNNGIVMRSDQLTASMAAFGVGLDGAVALLTKHGQLVNTMGINKINDLGLAFKNLTRGGTALGLSQDQSNEMLLSYTEILRTSARLRRYSDLEIITNAKEFANQMELSAQVTGKSREQLTQETKDRQSQYDVQFQYMNMTKEQQKQLDMLQVTLHKLGPAGDDLYTAFVNFKAKGWGGLSLDMQTVLSNSGAGEYFQKMSDAQSQEELVPLLKQFVDQVEINPLNSAHGAAGDKLYGAAMIEGGINTMVAPLDTLISKLANPDNKQTGGAEPVDKTAAAVVETVQTINQSMSKLDGAFTDIALTAATKLIPEMQAVNDKMIDMADYLSNNARLLQTDPGKVWADNKVVISLAAAAGMSMAIPWIISMFNSGKVSAAGTAGAAGIGAAGAAEKTFFGRLTSTFKWLGMGMLIGEAGSVAKATGHEKVGAGLEAGGGILTDTVIGSIVGSFLKKSKWGGLAGAAYGAYQHWDDIATVLGGSATPTASAATVPDTITTTPNANATIATNGVSTDNSVIDVTPLITELDKNHIAITRQNNDSSAKFDKMIALLTTLDTHITEQTDALKTAIGNGNGNVYP